MGLGIVFAFLASVGFNLSNLMEKRAVDTMHAISARRTATMIRALASSRLWIAGFAVGIVAVGLMVIAYSQAPIAVVQSIFGAGLVFLVVVARIHLGERMGKREWSGLVVIVAAVVLVSVTLGSSSRPGDGGSTNDVIIASAATTIFAVFVFVVLRRVSIDPNASFGITSGLFYGVASLQTKSASEIVSRHGIARSVIPILESPYPYVFLVTSVLGLLVFQSGLQRCKVAVVAPLTNIVASIYVVAVGMELFAEHLPRSEFFTICRLLGFAGVLIGSWILAAGPAGASEVLAIAHPHPAE